MRMILSREKALREHFPQNPMQCRDKTFLRIYYLWWKTLADRRRGGLNRYFGDGVVVIMYMRLRREIAALIVVIMCFG